jgi:hypothetical protein
MLSKIFLFNASIFSRLEDLSCNSPAKANRDLSCEERGTVNAVVPRVGQFPVFLFLISAYASLFLEDQAAPICRLTCRQDSSSGQNVES